MNWTTLVTPKSLVDVHEHSQIRIVDCRFSLADISMGSRQYRTGHLPGAVYAHLDNNLSAPVIPGITGRHPLPSRDEFAETISLWGIRHEDQIVAYDDAGGPYAARFWWMMRWLGHRRCAVLDGGWSAWIRSGYPVSQEYRTWDRSIYTPGPAIVKRVDSVAVAEASRSGSSILIDARASERYLGEIEPIDPIAGHIPGAVSIPWKGNLNAQGNFRVTEELKKRFVSALDGADSGDIISYCGSGVTAAHNLLAMEHAGLGTAVLYAGSWSEWITRMDRPVSVGNEGS